MALFKIFEGLADELKQLTTTKKGYAYYLPEESNLYIDNTDGTTATPGNRKKIIGLSQSSKQFVLTVEGWDSNNLQTVNNPSTLGDFFKSEGYNYFISPIDADYDKYNDAGIRGKIINEGNMIFVCSDKPVENITVNVLRSEEDPYYGK